MNMETNTSISTNPSAQEGSLDDILQYIRLPPFDTVKIETALKTIIIERGPDTLERCVEALKQVCGAPSVEVPENYPVVSILMAYFAASKQEQSNARSALDATLKMALVDCPADKFDDMVAQLLKKTRYEDTCDELRDGVACYFKNNAQYHVAEDGLDTTVVNQLTTAILSYRRHLSDAESRARGVLHENLRAALVNFPSDQFDEMVARLLKKTIDENTPKNILDQVLLYFKWIKFYVPWRGDEAVRRYIARFEDVSIETIWALEHARFNSETLRKAFAQMVLVVWDAAVGGGVPEFPIGEGRHSRFVEPPGGEIAHPGFDLVQGILNAFIGASGSGKTIAALRSATLATNENENCFVLYCLANSMFRECTFLRSGGDEKARAARNSDVKKVVMEFVKKWAMTAKQRRMETLKKCTEPTVLRVVVDEMGQFACHLWALCAMHSEICKDLAEVLGVTRVEFLVVGTGVDVAVAAVGSRGCRYRVHCVATSTWPTCSRLMKGRVPNRTSQRYRTLEIVDEVLQSEQPPRDPRLRRLKMALQNARLATLFAALIHSTVGDDILCPPDEPLIDGISFLLLLSVKEFTTMNALKTSTNPYAWIWQALEYSMNAHTRAEMEENWTQMASRLGITTSSAQESHEVPANAVEVLSFDPDTEEWVEGEISQAKWFRYSLPTCPYALVGQAYVAMYLVYFFAAFPHGSSPDDLERRALELALLAAGMPTVDDSGRDDRVRVSALTPFRRIVNFLTISRKELDKMSPKYREEVIRNDAPTFANALKQAKWAPPVHHALMTRRVERRCFDSDDEGKPFREELLAILKEKRILAFRNADFASYADGCGGSWRGQADPAPVPALR